RAAAAEVDAAEALERATRSVSAFETELSMRADEDARRLRRFAAAEQLRAQVAALAETLGRAEEEARAAHEEATGRMAVAEADLDRALAALDALTRRARSLAQQVPVERRPVGEPLATLDALAPALQERAAQLAPEREAAEESAAAAVARQ